MTAGGIAIGFAVDMIWGDGCYTWEEALWDAGFGIAGGLAFKGIAAGWKAWRGAGPATRGLAGRGGSAGSRLGGAVDDAAGGASSAAPHGVAGITGYTRHGLNQAISRNGGRGVSAAAILNAVRNPSKVVPDYARETMKFTGQRIGRSQTSVVMSSQGRIITAFGTRRGPASGGAQTARQQGGGAVQRRANELGFSYWPGAVR